MSQSPPPTGHQPPPPPYNDPHVRAPGVTVAALICGIVGICFFPLALVALICGIIGLTKTGTPGADKGRGFAITGTVLGGVGLIITPLIIAILLPALGAARRTARRMQNSTQLRGIHQGMVTYANSNRNNFAGLSGNGRILADGTLTGNSGDGNTPQARMWVMLNGNFFSPDYAISPSETDSSIIAYSGSGSVTDRNYSYALVSFKKTGEASGDPPTYDIDPETMPRAAEWKQTLNSQAVVLSDRNIGSDPNTNIQSIHSDAGSWRGSVLWNDNHVGFENTAVFQTKYADGSMNTSDHLFIDEPASPNNPIVGANALMVHDKP